jgi:hypothetical protein
VDEMLYRTLESVNILELQSRRTRALGRTSAKRTSRTYNGLASIDGGQHYLCV